MKGKKYVSMLERYLLTIALLVGIISSGFSAVAFGSSDKTGSAQRTREINIVYDDSGSMYIGSKWAQAKYALEVFTAMMGENDTLNVYELSENAAKPSYTLSGSDDAQNNVNIVNTRDGGGNTPFTPVRQAASNIMNSQADEKWLVILTDGEFGGSADPGGEILSYVGQNNTKVVYVAITDNGDSSAVMDLTPYGREMFYPYLAGGHNMSILDTMTTVASLVYNYKPMTLSGVGSGTISFDADIPLSKIVIFAQGNNVSVSDVSVNGNNLQNANDRTVNVRVDASSGGANYGGTLDDNLKGIVYTAKAKDEEKPFADGNYSFSCNVDNVQVFVEPGVLVKAVLRGETGEAIDLETGNLKEIPEGDWTVEVQMVNPLTGAVIDPSQSDILAGAYSEIVITDDQGNVNHYGNGEMVNISGESVEIYGRSVFPGMTETIEKTSDVHKLKVSKGRLYIAFGAPGGYELDAVVLQPDQEITFAVSINGKQLTATQSQDIKFKVEATDGIAWDVEKIDDAGNFRLIPSYAKRKGLKAVNGGETELTIAATLRDGGDKREGEGFVKLNISTETKAGLSLNLTMPEENIPSEKGDKLYMFDAEVRGEPTDTAGDQERPYILVEVQALNPDGSTRLLTDEEWTDGVENFSFSAQERYPGVIWKFFRVVRAQDLNFTAVKGSSPSTYKLYLSGLTPVGVLPNTSDLTVTLTYKYDNGAQLSGSADGVVSVKPTSLLRYMPWYLLVILAMLLISLPFIIKFIRKPKFPRNFAPYVHTVSAANGQATGGPWEYKARFNRTNVMGFKPQQAKIKIRQQGTGNRSGVDFTFLVEAIDKQGGFKLVRLSPFAPYQGSCTFDNVPYKKMNADNAWQNQEFNHIGSEFVIRRKSGTHNYTVKITFIEP